MSITVRDCLELPSLKMGKVVAGRDGLDSIVSTVSVIEFTDYCAEDMYTPNELVISSLFSVKNNVADQCRTIQFSKDSGDVGLVLFYSDIILNGIDPMLLEMADEMSYPIILLPGRDMGLCYSNVISEVMEAVVLDSLKSKSFVSNTIERFKQMPQSERTMANLMSLACTYSKASLFLVYDGLVISKACWIDFPIAQGDNFEEIIKSTRNFYFRKLEGIISSEEGETIKLVALAKEKKLDKNIFEEIKEAVTVFSKEFGYSLNVADKRGIIPRVIEGDIEACKIIAKGCKIDIGQFNTFIILKDDQGESEKSLSEKIRQLRQEYGENIIVDQYGGDLVILGSTYTMNPYYKIVFEQLLEEISSYYTTIFYKENMVESCRNYYTLTSKVFYSLRSIYPKRRIFYCEDVDFAHRCKKITLSLDDVSKEHYNRLLEPIGNTKEEELIKTLEVYMLDCDSSVKKTAKELYVHRNTVLYRINKIKDMLIKDIDKMPFYYELYTALALNRLDAL